MKNFARSLAIHAAIVALILLTVSVAHRVVPSPVRHHQTLVLPLALPVPTIRPAPGLPAPAARLAIGRSSSQLRVTPSPTPEPRLVAMSIAQPSSLELPSTSTPRVTAAPVTRAVGFEQETASAGNHASPTVSQGGFGTVYAGVGTGHGSARIVAAGFEVSLALAPVVRRTAELSVVPPVVSATARPVYTPEARAARVQGDVVLRVRFNVDGSVTILGVTNGLPYGLTESAIRSAAGVKFSPAMRGNQAVPFETSVTVTFQLAL